MGTVIESDVSGTSQNFDNLSRAEQQEYEAWLDSLTLEQKAKHLERMDTLILIEAYEDMEEEQRLQQQAQQAAEDEEYFNAASAYEMRF